MSVSGPGNEWGGHDRFIAETGDTQIWILHQGLEAGGGIYEGNKSAKHSSCWFIRVVKIVTKAKLKYRYISS